MVLSSALFASPVSVKPAAGGEGIQAALDAAPAGGEVVLEAGTYLVRTPIILRKDGQALRGAGRGTILALADEANCPVIIMGSLKNFLTAPTKNLRVSDLSIDGNRTKQAHEVWKFLPEGPGVYNNGIDVWGALDSTIERVVCAHCRSGGFVPAAGTRRLTVRDIEAFDNQFDGIACFQVEDCHFSGLNMHDNLAAGVSLDGGFNNNEFRDLDLANNDIGVFMRQSRSNVFEDVKIRQSHHHGVFMAQTGEQTASGWKLRPGSECAGNVFAGLLISRSGGKAFVIHDAGCVNNTVFGGRFVENAEGDLSEEAADLVALRPISDRAPVHLTNRGS
jgi:hypothetical protein